MTDAARPAMGAHRHRYEPLPENFSEAIKNQFNTDNPFFPGRLGFRVVEVRKGYAHLEVDNGTATSNYSGVMHGGASFGLADTAVAVALVSLYGGSAALLTIEMKINYLEPIFHGTVTAEAYVVRSSRRSAYAEVDIWAAGKLAARASTTYMIKYPRESGAGGAT